jgi:hypothetical protein
MKAQKKFKGLGRNTTTNEMQWFFYGIGDKPVLLGYEWVVEDLQFTGRIDIHGKEAYDGDLIKGDGYGPYPIEWCDRGFYSCSCYSDYDNIAMYETIEVVGTLVENPEYWKDQE